MTLQARLDKYKHIDVSTNCWVWFGYADRQNYGVIHLTIGKRFVHRLSFELANKIQLRSDELVLHRCGNPRCFNPEHLYNGTQSENLYDTVRHGRHPMRRKTYCPQGHEYTPENTVLVGPNKTGRVCLICKRVKSRAAYHQKMNNLTKKKEN